MLRISDESYERVQDIIEDMSCCCEFEDDYDQWEDIAASSMASFLSYISKEMQEQLVKAMSEQEVSVIDMKMAKQLREIAGSYASPSEEIITEVLCGTYGEDEKPKEKGEKVTIPKATYSRYLGGYSKKEANLIIEKALAYYFENNEEEKA